MSSHLGDNFNYKVTKRLTQEAKDKQWFSDMIDDRNRLYSEITYTNNTSSIFKEMFETLSVDNQQTTEAKLENLIEERNKVYKY
jgi:shikimate kinase